MAHTPDLRECTGCRRQGDAQLPIDPWRSLAVHFGMLLGTDDFQTIDAYHRGKMWLHAGWLHREGVVWGLRPSFVAATGELRLEPGLALDACGRELHLDRPACIALGAWFSTHAGRLLGDGTEEGTIVPADPTIGLEHLEDGRVRLHAHVRMRFVGCLDRQVPALLEPCDGAGRTTAYSRTYETVELELVPGLPAAVPPAYPRVRALFGLPTPEAPAPEVLEARASIAALPPEQRAAGFEDALHRFAALDAAELTPATDEETGGGGLLPALDPAWFVLAEVHGLTLQPDGDGWIHAPEVDHDALLWTHRPTHIATRPLQDLLAPSLVSTVAVTSAGPRVLRTSVEIADVDDTSSSFTADKPLDPLFFAAPPSQIQLTAFAAGVWQDLAISDAVLDVEGTAVTLTHAPIPSDTTRVRLRIDGTSSTPLLGADGWPLAGADDDPPASAHTGRDFVHMHLQAGE